MAVAAWDNRGNDVTDTFQNPDYTRLPEPGIDLYLAPMDPMESFNNRYGPGRRLELPPTVFDPETWELKQQPDYDALDHEIWRTLYDRQLELLPTRACEQYLRHLSTLDFGRGIPTFATDINPRLKAATGWTVVAVPSLIPDHVFFWHLANKRFPAGAFIRGRPLLKGAEEIVPNPRSEAGLEALKYVEEPDVFHDILGHVPMLMEREFADYMEAYGKAGWKAMHHNRLKALGALYWYTVEFGLIREKGELKIYGAGILSSPDECRFALESASPNRMHLIVDRVLRTEYVINDLQDSYFVIDTFQELFQLTEKRDFTHIYESLPPGFLYSPKAVTEYDHPYGKRGTQEYKTVGGSGGWERRKAFLRENGIDPAGR